MSDTQSLASEEAASMSSSSNFVEVEESGKLLLEEINAQSCKKKLVVLENILALLVEDGNVLLGEVKPDRNSNSWALQSPTLAIPPNSAALQGGRIMDICLLPANGIDKKTLVMVLLSERKNKERFLSSHLVTRERNFFQLSEETSVYDKGRFKETLFFIDVTFYFVLIRQCFGQKHHGFGYRPRVSIHRKQLGA